MDLIKLFNKGNDYMDFKIDTYIDMTNFEKTGFIIEILLPAVRDNAEFEDGFWDWMLEKGYGDGSISKVLCDDKGWMTTTPQMLLGYELEYVKEVLSERN